ncbi:hypothetical protein GCM10009530_15070 [Microbispora corallina]|uniref:Pectate lyase n=1 Tax=Microbispora corallina TaxID=83302 RepID=A0ABQ4FXH3_9ACTN|nr:hypothetical protein Mco01_24650 [Microbispora corallina]
MSGSTYQVVDANGGKCLNVMDSSTAAGAPVQQNSCDSVTSKRWTLQPAGSIPTGTPTPTPTRTPTPTPTPTSPPPSGGWPGANGSQAVSSTISVSGTVDGGLKRYYATGNMGDYRGCGNCGNSYQRNVVISNVTATSPGKALAGINTNWGDTARFSNITIVNDPSREISICDKYKGVPKGSEPTKIGSGADGVNCIYSASDITYR